MRIENAAALVTGAGQGLGAATARMLADRGARVAVLDLNADAANATAQAIGGLAVPADVSDAGAVDAALAKAEADLGPVRILVNCAGIAPAARIVGRDGPHDFALFERVIRVNLMGTFNTMRLMAARLWDAEPLEDGTRGAIVNTASIAALEGQIGQAAYAASKGGVVALALPAAREFARAGIRVNTVAPGIFRTPLLEQLPAEVQASLAAAIPCPSRLGEPAEYADAVRFCIENGYLNGELIRLDGAIRMQPK